MNLKSNMKFIGVLLLTLITANVFNIIPPVYSVDWSPDMRITWDADEDRYPSIAQAENGNIWFSWHSRRTGDYEIFYKIYDPTQANPWSPDIQLTNAPGIDMTPSITHTIENHTLVAWTSWRGINRGIYYKIYNGTSWTDNTILVSNSSDNASPSLMQTANGTIWAFFSSNRAGNYEIFYKTSSNNGASWSGDRQVTFTSNQDEKDPYVTQSSDGQIWLVYEKNYDIFYMTSLDGVSWSSAGSITTDPNTDWHPSIAQASDGNMWAVWDSDRATPSDPQNDIFYSVYDGTWSNAVRFTLDSGEDDMPSIMRANDGVLWVTWSATRLGFHDIYYRTSSLPDPHDVAIFNVAAAESIVAQGRSVIVEVVAQNHGTNSETFNITLYANTTLIGSQQIVNLYPGELYPVNFNWSTSNATQLGYYTLMANATVVPDETHTVDNQYVDGEVWVVIHDVAVTGVTLTATLVYRGYTSYRVIYVDVKNKGTISEDLTVTTYYNSTIIGIQTVGLDPDENTTLLFFFITSSLSLGNYAISAEATPLPDEENQTDNYLDGGIIMVTIPCDLNGDRTVDMFDWTTLSAHWSPGPPLGPFGYELFADVDEDGEIGIVDTALMSSQWGQSW